MLNARKLAFAIDSLPQPYGIGDPLPQQEIAGINSGRKPSANHSLATFAVTGHNRMIYHEAKLIYGTCNGAAGAIAGNGFAVVTGFECTIFWRFARERVIMRSMRN